MKRGGNNEQKQDPGKVHQGTLIRPLFAQCDMPCATTWSSALSSWVPMDQITQTFTALSWTYESEMPWPLHIEVGQQHWRKLIHSQCCQQQLPTTPGWFTSSISRSVFFSIFPPSWWLPHKELWRKIWRFSAQHCHPAGMRTNYGCSLSDGHTQTLSCSFTECGPASNSVSSLYSCMQPGNCSQVFVQIKSLHMNMQESNHHGMLLAKFIKICEWLCKEYPGRATPAVKHVNPSSTAIRQEGSEGDLYYCCLTVRWTLAIQHRLKAPSQTGWAEGLRL